MKVAAHQDLANPELAGDDRVRAFGNAAADHFAGVAGELHPGLEMRRVRPTLSSATLAARSPS